MQKVIVDSAEYGGLSFKGRAEMALEIAGLLRPVIEDRYVPNYLNDFVFALEVACQDAGLLDEDFNRIG